MAGKCAEGRPTSLGTGDAWMKPTGRHQLTAARIAIIQKRKGRAGKGAGSLCWWEWDRQNRLRGPRKVNRGVTT